MSYELLAGCAGFAFAMAFTPGPNNIMLMTSGVNFGLRRTQPHRIGVTLGVAFMTMIVGVGVGALIAANPLIYTVLKFGGAAYLLFLAWQIAASGAVEGVESARPISALEAAAFQWVNPKAWIAVIGGVSAYAALAAFPLNVMVITALFAATTLVSTFIWVVMGASLRRFITNPAIARIFNAAMALLLVVSLFPILFD